MGNHTSKNETDNFNLNLGAIQSSHTQQKSIVHFTFPEIGKKFSLDINNNRAKFGTIKSEFLEKIKLPKDASIQCSRKNSLTGIFENIDDGELVKNLDKKEVLIEIPNKGTQIKIINVSLYVVDDGVRVVSTLTYNFLPLKFIIFLENLAKVYPRVFRSTDILLQDPIEPDLTPLELGLDGEDEMFIAHFPSISDMMKIIVHDSKDTYLLEVDRFMKMAELNYLFNKTFKKSIILCDNEFGLRVNEHTLIGALANDNKNVGFIAKDFDSYYKNSLEPPKSNPLDYQDEVTNLLQIPD